MSAARPRKMLPEHKTPTEIDYKRWERSDLSPDDIAWKTEWYAQTIEMARVNALANTSSSASWIEPDLTFVLRVSMLVF